MIYEPACESSPEHAVLVFSEGEVPLLEETELATSPPFVRAPLEDRSKYEKLLQINYDSENSSHDELHEMNRAKKKRRVRNKLPELPIVKILRGGKDINSNRPELESDDSIGSASDLRETEEIERSVKNDNETISDVRTCGSSAYHAECESMATQEDDATSRIIRAKLREKSQMQQPPEDMLFVGHQYGEKPLLLDDELDSDCEVKYDNHKWSVEKKTTGGLWIEPSSSYEESDVFALAPFNKKTARKQIKLEPIESLNHSPIEKPNLNPFLTEDVVQNASTFGTVTVNSTAVNIDIPAKTETNNFFITQNFNTYFTDIDVKNTIYENVSLPPPQYTTAEFKFSRSQQTNSLDRNVSANETFWAMENEEKQNQKEDKKKSKYVLFDDALPNTTDKKTRKKASKTKVSPTIVQGGFSNMSFEDFPSDEGEFQANSVMPFEVLRPVEDAERKFGSLKRLSNPFS